MDDLKPHDCRARFREWTACLLDSDRAPIEHLDAARAWHDWGLAVLGIDETRPNDPTDPFFADTQLPTGKAISPLGAIRCVREYRRTAVFLQAMDAALAEARRRFPGETLHVVEAGCGPLAPLALPFALRHPPEAIAFTLLDLHPVSLDAVRRIVELLGLGASIRGYVAADATSVTFVEGDRPHVIACEVLLRALTREPQVAATINLAPQLRPGGIFIPQRIDVDAALFSSPRHLEPPVGVRQQPEGGDIVCNSAGTQSLGTVFSLDAERVSELAADPHGTFPAESVVVPPHDLRMARLELMTRIQVFSAHQLGDLESSLNLPERVRYPAEMAARGGTIDFAYESRGDPGLRVMGARIGGALR